MVNTLQTTPKISIAALLVFFLACSCQTRSQRETSASTSAPADSAAMLAARPTPDAPRSAADRLIRALYFEHRTKENPLLETKDRTLIDQFFTKSTADLIWRDARASVRKLNRTTTNPLFNVSDNVVEKTWVLPAAVAGPRAVVYVTFLQRYKPVEIRIDMQQVAGRWRIVDMRYPDGQQLTQLLR